MKTKLLTVEPPKRTGVPKARRLTVHLCPDREDVRYLGPRPRTFWNRLHVDTRGWHFMTALAPSGRFVSRRTEDGWELDHYEWAVFTRWVRE